MALTVEDGSGLSTAEAYCSVAFADAWNANRGATLWATMSTAEREQALRRAAQFMVQNYRLRWGGYRKYSGQALDWPRYMVPRKDLPGSYGGASYGLYYDESSVPTEVQQANAELAYKASFGDLQPDLGPAKTATKIGPIEVQYQAGARQTKRYVVIDAMLMPLLKDNGSNVSVMRA